MDRVQNRADPSLVPSTVVRRGACTLQFEPPERAGRSCLADVAFGVLSSLPALQGADRSTLEAAPSRFLFIEGSKASFTKVDWGEAEAGDDGVKLGPCCRFEGDLTLLVTDGAGHRTVLVNRLSKRVAKQGSSFTRRVKRFVTE